jgi:hypothetical protein
MKNSRSLLATIVVAALVLLGVAIFLIIQIGKVVSTPIQFENHFEERTAAVVEKGQYVVKLEQAYRDNNPEKKFTVNWDELTDFALNGTMEYHSQIYDENNLENAAIIEELRKQDPNWKNERVVRVAVRDTVFDDIYGKCRLTEEEMANLRYIPFTNNEVEFQLDTATYESGAYRTHLVCCHAPYVKFIDHKTYNKEFWNLLDEKFVYFINHQDASEDMKKMKAEGIKAVFDKKGEDKYMIGTSHPIPMDDQFFGITFGSLEEPTNEALQPLRGGSAK